MRPEIRDAPGLRRGERVAAMRKLLIAVYFVAKHRKPFVPVLAEART